MDNSINSDSEQSQNREARYLEFIELLIDKSTERLKRKTYKPKIQDALRAIRLKHKVFKDSEAENALWNMIEKVRQEELPKMFPESAPEPLDLESQIINTIKGLEYQVTNGTLPVQTITDYFNYHKPNEIRLSYSRLGRILSAMGFRKTRISNGRSAIFWDDRLLSDDSPGVQKLASASGSLLERSGNPAEGGASASGSLLERSENPAEGRASASDNGMNRMVYTDGEASTDNEISQDASDSCQTDSTEGDAAISSNSSVSNVCNSLPDNDLREK